MITIEQLKEGLEKIGYSITDKDKMTESRVIKNHKGKSICAVWYDRRIEFDIHDNLKGSLHLKNAEIGISSVTTLSIGAKDESAFFQFYNFNNRPK